MQPGITGASISPHTADAPIDGSEREFRLLADSLPQIVWRADPRGGCTWLNRRWSEYTGLPTEEALGDGWRAAVHPDDLPTLLAACPGAETRETLELEFRLLGRDSAYRWFLGRAEPVRDERDEIVHWFGTATEIHHPSSSEDRALRRETPEARRPSVTPDAERRRELTEEALRTRSEQFRALLDQAPLGIYMVDADFRLAQVNPVAQAVFGNIPGLVGRDFDEVLSIVWPGPVAEEAREIFRHTLETGEPHHTPELAEVRADRGVTEYYDWRVHRITLPDGRYGVVCYFTDISAQVNARRAIAASEERYRTLFNSIDEGFCVIEMIFDAQDRPVDYRFLEVNPVFERQTGLRDVAGKTARELVPDLEGHWFETYGSVVRTGEPVRFINEAQAMDGRWFDVYAFRLGGPESRRVALLFSDISERRQAEQALRAANRSKDEFVAMLAHELRNPLAPIRTAIRILEMQGPPNPELRRQREIVDRQVANMARLLDDLLDVSRLSRGTVLLQREPLNAVRVIQDTVDACGPVLQERGQELRLLLSEEPLPVYADRVRLEQVVINLLSNAAKYSDPGSRIDLEAARQGDQVVIRVRDPGQGISPDLLPHVFELFFQAERGLARAEGGLGIGLTMVRRLVEMHGGRVEARSEGPGRGSEFIVTLPLTDRALPAEEPKRPAPHASPSRAAGERRRVLVVDDLADNAETLVDLLNLWGYEARPALSGAQALEEVERFSPHVVFLDLGMPEMDGFAVAEALRGRSPHPVLVALTGYGQEQDRLRTREAGFAHHLTKPVDPDEVQRLLDHYASPGQGGLND